MKTRLDPRQVVRELKLLFNEDPAGSQFTLKWVPVDLWTSSDIESMKAAVLQIRGAISSGQLWRMTVEKRRYSLYHKLGIIKALAESVDAKVGLKSPDKILRVDIISNRAGLSVLLPNEVFSTTKMPCVNSHEARS